MIKTNGGCSFPCWLGIVPGQTRLVEALASLAPFADRIILGGPYYSYRIYFTLPESLGGLKDLSAGLYDENGIITVIQTVMPISLANLLRTYGPPSEVFIQAIGWSTLATVGQFTLVLYYHDKGILAVYDGEVARGRLLYISPDLITRPKSTFLLLWDPNKNMSFAEAARRTQLITPPSLTEEDYLSLENVTNLNAQSFYQRYKDPQNSGLYFQMEAPDYPKDKP